MAGTGGDAGKTLVALAMICALRKRGRHPAAYKKGPDFIDAAWLGWAAGKDARNLDSFLLGWDGVEASFLESAPGDEISVIEGNRGLLDGVDSASTHSTAALASHLRAPVVLVLGVRKITATAAAWVEGCRRLAPEAEIRGVILNRIAGARHARVAAQAVEALGVPVVGSIPAIRGEEHLPARHLGLVTPEEHGGLEGLEDRLASIAEAHLDMDRLVGIALSAVPLSPRAPAAPAPLERIARIGILRDPAFSFYYPDNLEALEREGASLVPVSALVDRSLPDVDGLVIGGGFPEAHAALLGANDGLRADVRRAAVAGMPIYAECGGLMYLARSLRWKDEVHPMVGVLPFDVVMHERPQGHGYARATVDGPNAFLDVGAEIVGHEFHYSAPGPDAPPSGTVYAVGRGTGCGKGRDGATSGSVLAAYIHLHARGCASWAPGIVRAAHRFATGRR